MADEIVGSVAVEVIGDAKNLAKNIRKEIESSFKDLDFNKLVQDAVGSKPIKLNVQPDFDTSTIGEKVRQTRAPKVPVELDPVIAAFQAEVRRQTSALARQVAIKVPVDADDGRLRTELTAQLQAVQAQARLTVPTEPGAKAEYEAKLRAQLAEVGERVKQTVKVEAKVDTKSIGNPLSGLSGILPDIGGIGQAIQGLATNLASFAGEAAQGGNQLAGSIAAAAGPIGTVISLLVSAATAMGALSGAAILAVPAITAVAGAAAAIPAALSGIGAAVGTFALGFKGISEALKTKPKTGGGGGGGGADPAAQARSIAAAERGLDAARRGVTAAARGEAAAERGLVSARQGVADAEQNLADAQKKSTQAQQAVNLARKAAAEDIDDLGRALRGAQLDEEGAALAVTDALRDLNEAKLTGNIPDIQKADLAYRQAQLTLENAKDSAKDLGEQQADSAKKGVEGSDKVVAALDAQQQAQEGVQSAQEGVLSAQNAVLSANDAIASAQDSQKSAADGLAAAQDSLAAAQTKTATSGSAAAGVVATKLAPAAQKFVDALKALKPAFEDLRLGVQQRLFEGLDKTVTNLGAAWIPALKITLGSYADTFNGFFKNLGAGISTPEFIVNIQTAAEYAREGLSKIGTAITKDLVPAFGELAAAAGPFLAQLGGKIAAGITEFSNFIDRVSTPDKGGRSQLGDFFDRASKALDSISTTGKLAVQIVGDLFSIITGAQASTGQTPLDSFNNALGKIHTFLSDPQNQKNLTDLIKGTADALIKFGNLASGVNSALDKVTTDGSGKGKSAGDAIGQAIVAGILAGIGEAMKASLISFAEYFSPFGPLISIIKNVLGIHSPSTVMAEIGHDLVAGLLGGIGDKLADLAGVAGRIKSTVIGQLTNPESWLRTHGGNAVIGFINGIGSKLGTLGSYAGNIRTTVQNRLADAGTFLRTHGGNTVIGFINGIGSRLSSLGSAAGNLRTTVSNALSNAGTVLSSAGRNIVIGLVNGIIAEIPGLGSILSYITAFIRAHKGPPSVDAVLLRPAGQLIMGGLISGIDDQKAALAAKLADVTSLVAGTDLPALGSDLGSVAGSLTSSSGVELSWAPGATGDPVLDGMRGLIKAKWRGNSVAALSTA